MRQRKTKVPFEVRDQMVEMYESGMSTLEIAASIGVSHQSVAYHLSRRGVQLRTRRGAKRGAEHHNWTGGRYIEGGYVVVKVDPADPIVGPMCSKGRHGDYVLEHRAVMARSMGRPLRQTETVHHKNGDKMDNRLENLQLRQGQHGPGIRLTCAKCGSDDLSVEEL